MKKVIRLGFILASSILIYSCDSGSTSNTPVATPCSSTFTNNDIHLSTETFIKDEIVRLNDINLSGYAYSQVRASGDYVNSVTQFVGSDGLTYFAFTTQPSNVNNMSPDISVFECNGGSLGRTNLQYPSNAALVDLFNTRNRSQDNIIWQ